MIYELNISIFKERMWKKAVICKARYLAYNFLASSAWFMHQKQAEALKEDLSNDVYGNTYLYVI